MDDQVLLPGDGTVSPPSADMPADAARTYIEASAVLGRSPRAAAALARLALQELCVDLGEKGSLDEAIHNLVEKGLRTEVQQVLDVIRVTGNNAIHPGTIDLRDDRDTAAAMLVQLNDIAYDVVTKPRERAARYAGLPETIRKRIAERDAPKPKP